MSSGNYRMASKNRLAGWRSLTEKSDLSDDIVIHVRRGESVEMYDYTFLPLHKTSKTGHARGARSKRASTARRAAQSAERKPPSTFEAVERD